MKTIDQFTCPKYLKVEEPTTDVMWKKMRGTTFWLKSLISNISVSCWKGKKGRRGAGIFPFCAPNNDLGKPLCFSGFPLVFQHNFTCIDDSEVANRGVIFNLCHMCSIPSFFHRQTQTLLISCQKFTPLLGEYQLGQYCLQVTVCILLGF